MLIVILIMDKQSFNILSIVLIIFDLSFNRRLIAIEFQ